MNPATINGSSVRLRKQGAGSDVPASVSYAGNTATLNPNADLDPGAVYNVTVAGTVADANGDRARGRRHLELHHRGPELQLHRHHRLRLQRRHPGRQHLRLPDRQRRGDPEADRGRRSSRGARYPAGWQSCTWLAGPLGPAIREAPPSRAAASTSTAPSPAPSPPSAPATRSSSPPPSAPPPSSTSASADDFNNVGELGDVQHQHHDQPALCSHQRRRQRDQLAPDPGPLAGTPHTYRIEWDTTQVRYYVDGMTLVATHAANFGATQMRPLASDFNSGGPEVSVDWLRMSPYPASGTFDSRVFDAGPGQSVNWGALTWNSATPPGTGIAISVRTGNTPTPDGTLERLHPDRHQRRRHPRQHPLRAVPGRAQHERPEPDADPERGHGQRRRGYLAVAVNDAATVAEDSGATAIDVLANDTDSGRRPEDDRLGDPARQRHRRDHRRRHRAHLPARTPTTATTPAPTPATTSPTP